MNKKGFTLIELLAVILILGIIALIAIPAVTNVIEDSKKGAAKASALHYIKAINDNNALAKLQPDKYTMIASGDVEEIEVNIKGDMPELGEITIENGKVTEGTFCMNGYEITIQGNTVTVGNKCVSPYEIKVYDKTGYTHKGIAYLNPTDLSMECNATNSAPTINNSTGKTIPNASGCKKFYIFEKTNKIYKLILEYNTTGQLSYASNNALNKLATDTQGWEGNPRLITVNEVAHIVGADRDDTLQWDVAKTYGTTVGTQKSWFFFDGSGSDYSGWQTQVATSSNHSRYSWLYDNSYECSSYGCDLQTGAWARGYWTSNYDHASCYTLSGSCVWGVSQEGRIYGMKETESGKYGIRPVIELPKRYFK